MELQLWHEEDGFATLKLKGTFHSDDAPQLTSQLRQISRFVQAWTVVNLTELEIVDMPSMRALANCIHQLNQKGGTQADTSRHAALAQNRYEHIITVY